jgi:AhpC/TSA family
VRARPSRTCVRAPPNRIPAPEFPVFLKWVNVPRVRMDRERGHPVLLEFWDFCRPSSLRTLPYIKGWYERYHPAGLQVIGVHCPGFEPAKDAGAVRAAVARLQIPYPVLIDPEFEVWRDYGNQGWPARYLWDSGGMLFEYHYGEGAYEETERAIQELLGLEAQPLAPVRPEDAEGVLLTPQTEDQAGAYSGPYEAGSVWAVFEGKGTIRVNGRELAVDHPGAYLLVEHATHREAELELEIGPGVTCHATCFSPGVTHAPA